MQIAKCRNLEDTAEFLSMLCISNSGRESTNSAHSINLNSKNGNVDFNKIQQIGFAKKHLVHEAL